MDELVPGRVYDVWGLGQHFRIHIGEGIISAKITSWHSEIDMEVVIEGHRVWTVPTGIPTRRFSNTSEQALDDAMRSLAEWAGINAVGRARRDAAAAEKIAPELRDVVDAIDESLESDFKEECWHNRDQARWSTSYLDFFVSRARQGQFVLVVYVRGSSEVVKSQYFELTKDGARAAAARIQQFTMRPS